MASKVGQFIRAHTMHCNSTGVSCFYEASYGGHPPSLANKVDSCTSTCLADNGKHFAAAFAAAGGGPAACGPQGAPEQLCPGVQHVACSSCCCHQEHQHQHMVQSRAGQIQRSACLAAETWSGSSYPQPGRTRAGLLQRAAAVALAAADSLGQACTQVHASKLPEGHSRPAGQHSCPPV